jgi:Na+-transporting NADH:ubiquinone oxidoreductase subunit C
MAIDKNSTGFTLTFVIIMVIIVGSVLASLAFGLKPLQKAHEADKKRMDIIGAIGVESERSTVNDVFTDYVSGFYLLDNNGKVTSTDQKAVFAVDIKKQHRNTELTESEKKFPLYTAKTDSGTEVFIVPMVGKGLWGPIWGYVAMEKDMKTIFGAKFDHKTETPGLGAEIKTDFFQKNWAGQELDIAANAKMMFEVTKGSGSSLGKHQVDGITGGTITSKGVQEMVNRTMLVYRKYESSTAQLN